MFEILEKYKHNGHFDFLQNDNLASVCNAPTNKSGVYMVWDATNKEKDLLYIGRSGKKVNGIIKHRIGGLKDRLVNGHQFGKIPRKRSWPIIMKQNDIRALSVNWFDTENDDPVEIEKTLLKEVIDFIGVLPCWNNQPY